jgi:hypothetical protein
VTTSSTVTSSSSSQSPGHSGSGTGVSVAKRVAVGGGREGDGVGVEKASRANRTVSFASRNMRPCAIRIHGGRWQDNPPGGPRLEERPEECRNDTKSTTYAPPLEWVSPISTPRPLRAAITARRFAP